MTKDQSTEQRIIAAATKVFVERGMAGARMQEIANEADINKAMLHYYFRTKKQLFQVIFEAKLGEMFRNLATIILSDLTFEEKVTQFVDLEITFLSRYPSLPLFVLNESWQSPDFIQEKMKEKAPILIGGFRKIYTEMAAERARAVIPFEQFMMNMFSLCNYPLIARPIIETVMDLSRSDYEKLINDRKKLVAQVLLQTINLSD